MPRPRPVLEVQRVSIPRTVLFDIVEAAEYIGVERSWLNDAPITRIDIRKPGAARPVWRWRVADLDAFIDERAVEPGRISPWGAG